MARRHIEEEIEALTQVREATREEACARLRKALADRVNLMPAKAAKLAAELDLRELVPDLLRTNDRLFTDAASRDPQCWGKNAIARALVSLDHRDSPPYIRGMRHVQMEPSFGKPVDTATTLRGICLLALLPCTDLTRDEVLRHLVDGLADPVKTVRIEAVRGLEAMEGESALLLRLKARVGDVESEVTGQVFDSLLNLEREAALPLIAEYLQAQREERGEAALALGNSRLPRAVDLLREAWNGARDTDYRQVILRALSISRQEPAIDFLLSLVRDARALDAKAAQEALSLHDSPEIRRRLAEAIDSNRKDRMEG